MVLGSFELPESDINGDTTLTFGLELVKNPSVLEGTLTEFSSFLLELLDGTLVDTTALVDQVTSSGGLSRIDVTNDDDVNVSLFLTHGAKEMDESLDAGCMRRMDGWIRHLPKKMCKREKDLEWSVTMVKIPSH